MLLGFVLNQNTKNLNQITEWKHFQQQHFYSVQHILPGQPGFVRKAFL